MISPEALEKARAVLDAIHAEGCPSERFALQTIAAALQVERDAAAPKLPDDMAGLVERLNGVYRVPITDGLGAVGSGEEPDNPNEFVQRFETPPIQKEAAAAIQSLAARNAELRAEIAALKKEASKFAELVQDYSNDGHLARAARAFLDKWEGRDG